MRWMGGTTTSWRVGRRWRETLRPANSSKQVHSHTRNHHTHHPRMHIGEDLEFRIEGVANIIEVFI